MRRRTAHAALLAALGIALAAHLGGCRDREPNTPIVLVGTPSGLGGSAVPVSFVLRSENTENINLQVFLFENGIPREATRAPGGESIDLIQASPGGTAHVFLWDALADLGPGRHTSVALRFIPYRRGQQGTIADTFLFVADNTDLFVGAPDLVFSRDRSGAAALPEGGVMVAGGGGLSGISEALDPATQRASVRSPLVTAREAAPMAVALVDDGAGDFEPQPTIVAGLGASAVSLTSVERYDSGEEEWVATGLDVGARVGHTVTRLADGRLLVAGGGPADDLVLDLRDPQAPTSAAIPSGADRTGHAATLLLDGRVLITGGRRAGALLSDTLVLSPGALSYATGPALLSARADHAAAIAAGRVLVTGGRDALGNVTRSAELSSATLTAFVATISSMIAAREGHTATGLADGSVLITGGNGASGTSLASAEKYFPSVDLFASTRGSLRVARRGHQATRWGAGRVLISGGGTDAIEIYYPQSLAGVQVFDPIASPAHGRTEHEVTALADGRALITGGTDGVVLGGAPAALSSTEVFDPVARSDRRLAPFAATMTAARRRHTATLLPDGTVLVAGGLGAGGVATASMEQFTPSTASFTPIVEALPQGLSEHTATRLDDGRVLIAGGLVTGGSTSAAAFLFDPAQASGSRLTTVAATLLAPRRRHTATLLADGRVLLAGGLDGAGAALASAEVFEPTNATFSATASDLGLARFGHAAVRLTSGAVLISGGRGGTEAAPATPTADVRSFEASSVSFTALAPMGQARAEHVAIAVFTDRAIFAGGVIGQAPPGAPDAAAPVTASAEIYTATGTNTTGPTPDPDLSTARRGLRAATINNGTALLIGGRREDAATVPGGERLQP